MKKTAMAFVLVLLAACSSSGGPKEMDQTLNNRTDDSSEKVGISDDKVVIQKKVYVEEQLWALKSEVDDLQKAIYGTTKEDPSGIFLGLKECRKRLADPRIGGLGKSDAMETWANITAPDEQFFYKVDKKTNSLIGVSQEDLDARLARYQTHKRLLNQKYDDMKDKLDSCEEKYRTALVNNGLNPDDTKARGQWVDGPKGYRVWKMKRAPTNDPEELQKRKVQENNEENAPAED